MARNPENSGRLGLALAAAALIGGPLAAYLAERARPLLADAPPPAYAAYVEAADAYWRENFRREFPGASAAYRSPSVRFSGVDHEEYSQDDFAGLYYGRFEEIQIDLSRDSAFTALVIAHEFGHHVQNLAGLDSVRARDELFAGEGSRLAIGRRYELQAECLAGVFLGAVESASGPITPAMIDRIRRGAAVDRGSPTHGTGAQQLFWFDRGYDGGTAACDTRAAASG